MGKEGNIINILTYQLNELENLIKKDVERGNMIYDFYINEEECKLLDFDKLQTYLTEVDIKNLASLKDIYQRCNRINNLWNDDLRLLKPKRLDKAFNISPEECKSRYFIHSIMDFHLIYLTAIKFHYITFEDEKKKFMIKWADNSTLKTTHLAKINTKCHDIRNLLINFYPTLRLEEDPKEGLIQYRNFGEYGFTPRPYKKNEYKLMKNVFNIYLSNCEYIFLSLDKNERHEFKTDVINNLNDVKNIQVLPKFKGLLSEIIVIANNNFKPPQQTNTPKEEEKDLKKPTDKWYALLYWIQLKANKEKPPINEDGAFIKSDLEAIGRKMSGRKGQSFYKVFKEIADDLNNLRLLNNKFPDWRDKIISLSENDEKIRIYINTHYKSKQ
jgi:hypothetical protein